MKIIFAYLLFLALLIELAAGNSAEHVANDFSASVVILICGIVSIVCFRLAIQILKIPVNTWNNNRKAALLAKKVNGLKELTTCEQAQLDNFINEGTLIAIPYIYAKQWQMYVKLSNNSVDEVLRY